MSRKSFPAAALIAAVLATPCANAVNLNPRGLGEALIYPYYTVNKGQDTLITLVNPSDTGRLVEVAFHEGINGRVTLDFWLYLSAHDAWSARVSQTGDASGAALFTNDASCTLPAIEAGGHLAFRTSQFDGSGTLPADGGPTGVTRTREGMFEIVALADVVPGSELDAAITHVQNGQPNGGVPSCDPDVLTQSSFTDIAPPSGGLHGSVAIINVGEGTFYAYNALALADFTDDSLIYAAGEMPGARLLDANSADTPAGAAATAHLIGDDGSPVPLDYARGIDAVSAVLMADSLVNEYLVSPALGASTDWVIAFPTRQGYVDEEGGGAPIGGPTRPFEEAAVDGLSRVTVPMATFDQEEGRLAEADDVPVAVTLDKHVNVLSFVDLQVDAGPLDRSRVFGSTLVATVPAHGDAGWARLDLASGGGGHELGPSLGGTILHGLPVAGFMAYNIINSNAAPGRLANYGGTFPHRTTVVHSQTPASEGN